MKALVLSAGRGERLGELTLGSPKCLLPVGGKPMVEFWLDKLSFAGVDDVLINLHYKYRDVLRYFADRNWDNVRVTFAYEKELLGSARTLWVNKSYFRREWLFMVVYGDTWTNMDLRKMIGFHKRHPGIATVALTKFPNPTSKGVVKVREGMIVGFEEKPVGVEGLNVWSFAGVVIASPRIFQVFDDKVEDVGKDLFPKLLGKMNAFYVNDAVYDIGESAEHYKKVCDEVKKLGLRAL